MFAGSWLPCLMLSWQGKLYAAVDHTYYTSCWFTIIGSLQLSYDVYGSKWFLIRVLSNVALFIQIKTRSPSVFSLIIILTRQCLLSCLRPKIFQRALWANKALGLFTPSTKTGCWSHDCNQPITELLLFSLKFNMVAFLLDLHALQVDFQHFTNKYTHKSNKIVLE